MTTPLTALSIDTLSSIADRFDAFFIDQFGVLHDGRLPYHGAVAALSALTGAGKHVLLLSNSGKRAASNVVRLERLGFERGLYTDIVTSGEVGWAMLASERAGQTCLLISSGGDRSAVAGLPIAITGEADACDFVLIAGSEGDRFPLDRYREWLAPAAARGVPAYCTNPDMQMLTPQGLRFGAGQIAMTYSELGGAVTWIGKPYPAIYAAARALVMDVPSERILCVGDSVEHDVTGAVRAGLATCLVRTGIIADIADGELAARIDRAGVSPNFILPNLQW